MGALSSFIYTVGRRIGLKVRKCFVRGRRYHYCHLPKMDVFDWVRLFCL
jgi:hypothetical protein